MPQDLVTVPALYPTTSVIVDDDGRFLSALAKALSPTLPLRLFTNPAAAVTYLNQEGAHQPFTQSWGEAVPSLSQVTLSLKEIAEESRSDGRFAEVSSVVVDYAMPAMNGLDMLRQLERPPHARILLTGQASNAIAVDAFNQQLISGYIEKSWQAPLRDLRDRLTEQQVALARARFDATSSLFSDPMFRIFFDHAFADWFADYRHQHAIIEHYWIASVHGFLCRDRAGQSRLLLAHDNDFINTQRSAIERHKGSADLLGALYAKNVVAVFPTDNGMFDPSVGDRWHDDLYLVNATVGDSVRYHIADVADPTHLLGAQPAIPYDHFIGVLDVLNARESR